MPKKKNRINPERAFKQVEKMLYKLAWGASNRHFPFEEAQSEVFWAFMQACQTFDDRPGGMKFSSWVYYKVWIHLRGFVSRKINRQPPLVFMEEIKDYLLKDQIAARSVREVIESREDLSKDAKQFLLCLLDPPESIMTLEFTWEGMGPISPEKLLKRVKRHIGFEYGRDEVRCEMTLMEIEDALKRKKLAL